jgi:RimJ/RimL family protein N-acetyltransferase
MTGTSDVSRYSVMETLRDGSLIEIRALRPADRDALRGTVDRMSDESIQRRFFAPKRHFSEREIDYFLNVDFVDHVALVAVLNEEGRGLIVGGGRYILGQPGIAEIAFAIDDPHQGRGIGALLLRHLTAIARAGGLAKFTAEVLAGNASMLKVFEKSGLALTTKREAGVVHVTLQLT